MARRLQQTLADYAVVAISPALIMVLVGSLVFFLLEVFYQGAYQGRLQFIFAMFVMAAVLIGRISMEEGTSYAAMFAVPLAVVTGLAIMQFVEIQGPLAGFSVMINWGLLALIWWCTHQLTWDCTLIDESQDASGQGLLQTVGLERGAVREPHVAERADNSETGREEPVEATTTRVDVALSWWQRLSQRQRRPHAPGVWVVHFSLAALPLFGIGQWFIPADNLASRRYVFWLLCLYVASGLGLLVTTSFLGLRRYLRQRQLQMPTEMAGAWLGVGALLIVALLAIAWLLPRPGAEYSITQIPITFGSPDLDPAPYGVGNDGPQADDASTTYSSEDSQDAAQSQEQGQGQDDSSSDSSDQGQPTGDGQQNGSQGQPSQGDSTEKGTKDDDSQADDGANAAGSEQGGESSDASQGNASQRKSKKKADDGKQQQQAENSADGDQQPTQEKQHSGGGQSASRDKQSASNDKSSSKSSRQASQSGGTKAPSSTTPRQIMQQAASWLPTLLKWLFYLILLAIAAYFIWRHWEKVRAFLVQFFNEMRELWDKLFGRKSQVGEEAAAAAEGPKARPPRPFSDFADPFAAGLATRWSTNELVKYSFEAFEAWAREHDCPRPPDQTPHEFAALVAAREAPLARDARNLADLYCHAAYAKDSLPDSSVAHMKQLWQNLHAGASDRTPATYGR
jgi:hypothetical protein